MLVKSLMENLVVVSTHFVEVENEKVVLAVESRLAFVLQQPLMKLVPLYYGFSGKGERG